MRAASAAALQRSSVQARVRGLKSERARSASAREASPPPKPTPRLHGPQFLPAGMAAARATPRDRESAPATPAASTAQTKCTTAGRQTWQTLRGSSSTKLYVWRRHKVRDGDARGTRLRAGSKQWKTLESLAAEGFADHFFGVTVLAVDRVVQLAHVVVSDLAGQRVERRLDLGMVRERLLANDGHGFGGRGGGAIGF